jgi:hypothetical protein
MSNFTVDGGLVAWVEGTSSTNSLGMETTTITGLKSLNASGTISTITSAPTTVLYGLGNGVVVYSALNKTYTWSAANGTSSKLLIDTTPVQVLISGSTMYFTQGASQNVYKITIQ